MEKVWKKFEKWYSSDPEEKKMTSKGYTANGFLAGWKAAQQNLHLTAIATCGMGVLIGLGIGWLWFGA